MIYLSTIFFLFTRIISNPLANVFQKKLSADYSSVIINLYAYIILSVLTIPFIPKYVLSINYNNELIFLILTAGFLCTMGIICLIKAVNIGELSVLGPINSYKSIIGLISAIFVLKEFPSIIGVIGILLIILGSRFIFDTTNEGFSFGLFKRKDIQLRFLALLLTGIEASLLKKIILMTSIETCMIFWCLSGAFWSFAFALITRKSFKIKSDNFIKLILIIAFCLGVMQYSTNFVFERMNVGYALALFQLSSILTVFLGYKFFKEKNIIRKLIGSIIMVFGSILIILF